MSSSHAIPLRSQERVSILYHIKKNTSNIVPSLHNQQSEMSTVSNVHSVNSPGFAQGVSDHESLERDNKQKFLQQATTSALKLQAIGKENQAQASSTNFKFDEQNQHFSRNGFNNDRFQEKDSEMDSDRSNCCCFLPRQLFLVQKTRTRGGLSGSLGTG